MATAEQQVEQIKEWAVRNCPLDKEWGGDYDAGFDDALEGVLKILGLKLEQAGWILVPREIKGTPNE